MTELQKEIEKMKAEIKQELEEKRQAQLENDKKLKADILLIKDRTERQKAIADNIELFL